MIQPNPMINGWGHYEDEYVEVDGKGKEKVSKKHDSVKSRLRPSVE